MPQGYGNGALVPDDAKALVRRIAEFEAEQGELLTGPTLWMKGTDHLMPQPWLGRVVAEANELSTGGEGADDDESYEMRHATLSGHVQAAPNHGQAEWARRLGRGQRGKAT